MNSLKLERVICGLALLALVSVGSGCNSMRGSGRIASESRSVKDFTSVELSGTGTLIIEQGDVESLSITTDDNLLEYLTADVVGSKLKLGTKELAQIRPSTGVTYKLLVKKLNAIGLAGGADLEVKGLLTDSLTVAVAGASDIRISGETHDQKIAISGAAKYNAENFKSKDAAITVTGAGSAVLAVSDRLNVHITGAGEVKYVGDPMVTQEVTGAGIVEKKS